MDENTGNGIHGRRSASRATKLRRRRQRMNFVLLAAFIAVIALLVIVTPKDPLQRASYTIASEDGGSTAEGERQEGTIQDGLLTVDKEQVTVLTSALELHKA